LIRSLLTPDSRGEGWVEKGSIARLSPGMAIPLKAISIGLSGGGLIFEGLREL
jgi:hypothetical protein